MLGDRIVEADAAFIDEDHQRGRGHRLGHRSDPEHCVLRHRPLRGQIGRADGLDEQRPVDVGDEHDRSGEMLLLDGWAENGLNALACRLAASHRRHCHKHEDSEDEPVGCRRWERCCLRHVVIRLG